MTPEQIEKRKESKRIFSNKYNMCKRLGIKKEELHEDVFELMQDEKAVYEFILANKHPKPEQTPASEKPDSNGELLKLCELCGVEKELLFRILRIADKIGAKPIANVIESLEVAAGIKTDLDHQLSTHDASFIIKLLKSRLSSDYGHTSQTRKGD